MNIHNKKKIPWIFNNEINKWWVLYEWLSGIVDYVSSSSLRIHDISILFVSNKVDVAHALDLLFCHLLMNNNIRCIINIKYLDFSLTRTGRIKWNFSKWKVADVRWREEQTICQGINSLLKPIKFWSIILHIWTDCKWIRKTNSINFHCVQMILKDNFSRTSTLILSIIVLGSNISKKQQIHFAYNVKYNLEYMIHIVLLEMSSLRIYCVVSATYP